MTRYSDDYRATAVVMLKSEGYPETRGALTRVAKYLKVAHSVLLRWYKSEQAAVSSQTVHEKTIDLREAIRFEISAALNEMGDARSDADYKELATAFGILFDKLQLLEGKPTERHEYTGLSPADRTQRITQLLDTAGTRRTGQSAISTND